MPSRTQLYHIMSHEYTAFVRPCALIEKIGHLVTTTEVVSHHRGFNGLRIYSIPIHTQYPSFLINMHRSHSIGSYDSRTESRQIEHQSNTADLTNPPSRSSSDLHPPAYRMSLPTEYPSPCKPTLPSKSSSNQTGPSWHMSPTHSPLPSLISNRVLFPVFLCVGFAISTRRKSNQFFVSFTCGGFVSLVRGEGALS